MRRSPPWCLTCPGSNGSIMPCSAAMRRIQRSLLMLMVRPGASGVLDDDVGELDRLVARLQREPARGLARDLAVAPRERGIGLRRDRGPAAVGLLADADVERQRAEQ